MMSARIDGILPVAGKKTVVVQVGEASFEVAASVAAELALEPGLEVTAGLRACLEAAAGRRLAAAEALRFLRGRPRTAREVRGRLLERGHALEVVEAVLAELDQSGIVNDARYAEWFVAARLAHRPTGPARLVHEMCLRGVPRPMAETAVGRILGESREEDLALAAARSRLVAVRRLGRERGLRRLASFLAGRGFGDATVRRVCLRLFAAEVPAPDSRLARGPSRLPPQPEEP